MCNTYGSPGSVGAHAKQAAAARQGLLHGQQVHFLQPVVHRGPAHPQAFKTGLVLRLRRLRAADSSPQLVQAHLQLGTVRITRVHLITTAVNTFLLKTVANQLSKKTHVYSETVLWIDGGTRNHN